jgi:hypothetical protein
MFSFSLQILAETFLFLRRTERDTNKSVYWSSCKVTDILTLFYLNFKLLNRFFKNFSILNSKKIRHVGAELFQTERQTDGQA